MRARQNMRDGRETRSRRGRGGYELEEEENREGRGVALWQTGTLAQTLGCPRMNKGWYKQCGQGVGTQIVGGPEIRVGWVKEVSMGLVGGVERYTKGYS